MTKDEILRLIDERDEVKIQLRTIDHTLANAVMDFNGTLQEALEARLVRLNFAAPAGFYRAISSRR